MKQAIRVLGLATFFLAVFFTAFVASVVYSAMGYRMDFGEPLCYPTEDGVEIAIPVFINNTGFHDVNGLNLTSILRSRRGEAVAAASTFVASIPHGRSMVVHHNISLNIGDLVASSEDLLFEDQDFIVEQYFSLNLGKVIPFNVFVDESLFWGAPFYNFSVSQIDYTFSSSHVEHVFAHVSFDNHSSFFDVAGLLRVVVFNSFGELVGEGSREFAVGMGERFDSAVEIHGVLSRFTGSGEVHVYFDAAPINYGPLVIPYGT